MGAANNNDEPPKIVEKDADATAVLKGLIPMLTGGDTPKPLHSLPVIEHEPQAVRDHRPPQSRDSLTKK
jgi:hypothetical protein